MYIDDPNRALSQLQKDINVKYQEIDKRIEKAKASQSIDEKKEILV